MDQNAKLKIFRDRFFGRQDVFGRKWQSEKDDGQIISGYAPVCDNFWKPNCHLRLKDGIRCDGCEVKQYTPVSDETVVKHLAGDEQHIYYVLQLDGTTKFLAMDFDMKEGKEDKGYKFEDVGRVLQILREWGVPYGVARSTGRGYHVYIFFDGFVAANKARGFAYELYERAGFMEYLRMGEKPIPEVFPKQSYNSPDGIGNGIKPPMIVTGLLKQRNGWVTDGDEWIGAGLPEKDMLAAQWKHFASIGKATAEKLDQLIKEHGIQVTEDGPGSNSSGRHLPTGRARSAGKWQPPLTGSIEKVMEGCAALRRIRDKCFRGEAPGHQEGFALYHLAMRTADGVEWFKKHVPGWGTNDTELKQLEHSIRKDYSPWTCRKMRENGVCAPNTECFKKKPPIEIVEGRMVERTDVPVDQWPEPSPIRFAFGKGDDFLLKLQREAEALKDMTDAEDKMRRLADIVYRAQVFDEAQQRELKDHLKKSKIAKAGEVAKLFNEAAEKSTEDLRETANQRSDTVDVHGNLYQKISPYGYAAMKLIRSKPKITQLCSNDIWIDEVRSYTDEEHVVRTVYRGRAVAQGIEKAFEIDAAKWQDNTEFLKFFGVLLGESFNILRQNVDFIRQACMAFSARQTISRSQFLVTQGFYGDSFLMPSVVIDKDGLRPNTEQHVDLSFKEHARALDFQILPEEEFKELLLHIKKDVLNTWPRLWTTVALAHTLTPVALRQLGLRQKPTLFFEGLTGSGKTQLTHLMQYFWGDFEGILNLASSGKGIMDVAHDFRDAMLVVDDFKGLNYHQTQAVELCIQYSYDPTSAIKLKRDSSQHKAKGSRAILTISGETFVSTQASMVARCILIEVDKHDTKATKDSYTRCWQMCKKYNGVTPRFIHWFLNNDKRKLKLRLQEATAKVFEKISGRQNADRVAHNLGLNHFMYQLWCDFLLHNEAVSHNEHAALIAEHWEFMETIQLSMIDRCEEEQNGVTFVRVLKQLISAGEVSIKNLQGFEHEKKTCIGYVPDRDSSEPNVVHLYPEIVYKTIKGYSRDLPIDGTERAIARQLADMRVIMEADKGRYKKLVRNKDVRQYVWICDMSKLGFVQELRVVGGSEKLEFTPAPAPPKDAEGIF